MSVRFVLNDPPYGPERSYNGSDAVWKKVLGAGEQADLPPCR